MHHTVNDLNVAIYSALYEYCPTVNYAQIENTTFFFIIQALLDGGNSKKPTFMSKEKYPLADEDLNEA